MEANTQKDEEIGVLGPNNTHMRLGTHFPAPRKMVRRLKSPHMHLTHGSRCLAPVPCGPRCCFVMFWCEKHDILAQV